MLQTAWNVVSFGERHFAATLAYLGLGLMLCALLSGSTPPLSGCDAYTPCEPGFKCCHGECVPDDYVCCEDGSAGPGESCFCCSDCAESSCTNPTTLLCPTPEDCEGAGGGEHGEG
jgi:hypothetical protein